MVPIGPVIAKKLFSHQTKTLVRVGCKAQFQFELSLAQFGPSLFIQGVIKINFRGSGGGSAKSMEFLLADALHSPSLALAMNVKKFSEDFYLKGSRRFSSSAVKLAVESICLNFKAIWNIYIYI